jgi:hypothetical protein
MKIAQLVKNGKAINNHLVILNEDNVYFQSYDTIVCCYNSTTKKITLTENSSGQVWDYSNTTRKHFAHFINTWTSGNYEYIDRKQWIEQVKKCNLVEITDYTLI